MRIALRVHVGQDVWLRRSGGRSAPLQLADACEPGRSHGRRVVRVRLIVRTKVDPKMKAAKREAIIRQECRSTHALAVHARSVGAPQITQDEKAVRLYYHTVKLRDALVIKAQIAVLLAPDYQQVALNLDGCSPVQGDELGPHDCPVADLCRAESLIL